MSPAPDTYRIGAAAKKLNVNRITVWRWVKDGKLPSFKIGSLTFIPGEALQPRMQPSCAEPEPYAAVRSNPVANAHTAALSEHHETPGNHRQHSAAQKPGSSRRIKGLEQRGAT
jgi:excisionase family DNA binding protein